MTSLLPPYCLENPCPSPGHQDLVAVVQGEWWARGHIYIAPHRHIPRFVPRRGSTYALGHSQTYACWIVAFGPRNYFHSLAHRWCTNVHLSMLQLLIVAQVVRVVVGLPTLSALDLFAAEAVVVLFDDFATLGVFAL